MKNTIFIGDIAGRLKELKEIYRCYPKKNKICVGDLQDRGSHSKQVLDFLMERDDTICLFGNHEEMFLLFMENDFNEDWVMFLLNGGLSTLESYLQGESKNKFLRLKEEIGFAMGMYWGTYEFRYKRDYKHEDFYQTRDYQNNKQKFDEIIDYLNNIKKQIPKKYIDFIKKLPRYIEGDEVIVSHAPLNHYPINESFVKEDDFIWNRMRIYDIGKDNIHGHNGYKSIKTLDNGYRFICVDDSKRSNLTIFDWDKQEFVSFF